jgi:hypothetical protein
LAVASSKRSGKGSPAAKPPNAAKPPTKRAAEQADYRTWKAHAAALLERQGLLPGIIRERDWRQIYIRGKSPEDATRQAETSYWNTRPPFERMRKR